MATLREQYEELFGDLDPYDPIKLGEGAKKRARAIQAEAPTASPARRRAIDFPDIDPVDPDVSALGAFLKTGTAMTGEALLGAAEYATRQLTPGTKGLFRAYRQPFMGATEALEATRGELAEYRKGIYESLGPEIMQRKGAEFLTLDPEKTIWKGSPLDVGESILYKFVESLPMSVLTLVPGAVLLRAGASTAGVRYLGASEAGLSVGFIANETTEGIQEMSDEELAKESPRFVQLLSTMDSPEAARYRLIQEAQGLAPILGGALVGAIGYSAGRYLEPVLTGVSAAGKPIQRGALGRAAQGAISEGLLQEGPQEVIEQLSANISASVYDGDRALTEGLAEAYVQGAVVGAPMGGIVGATIGGGAETKAPPPRDETEPPATFDEVFGPQTPPPGGYTGAPGDMFGEATTTPITDADVPADVAAAVSATIRREGRMDDMLAGVEALERSRVQPDLPLPAPIGQEVVHVGPPAGPEGQLELPLVQRRRGVPPQPIALPEGAPPPTEPPGPPGPPGPPPGQVEDLFAPPPAAVPPPPTAGELPAAEVEGFVVTVTDDAGNIIEEDIFETAEEAEVAADEFAELLPDANVNVTRARAPREFPVAPDEPTAEPLADIQAQLRDMQNPASPREAVFLSADNLTRLPGEQLREVLGDTGVRIPDFDGEGGLLIAENQEVAEGALAMKDIGMSMQGILGRLTGAGVGKPPVTGEEAVVQLRDGKGNVLQETVVATEEEAYALAEEWGTNAVVLTPAAVRLRRERLIAEEQRVAEEAREEREARREAERRIEEGLEEIPAEERPEAERVVKGAKKPSRAAARLVGAAAKRAAVEKRQRIGGFYSPNVLEFITKDMEQQYREVWDKLLDNQLKQAEIAAGVATRKSKRRKEKLAKEEKTLLKQLGKIRQLARPKRVVSKMVKAAAKIEPTIVPRPDVDKLTAAERAAERVAPSTLDEVKSILEEEIDTSDREVLAGQFEPMTRDEVQKLEGAELTVAFAEAAYWLAGRYPPKTGKQKLFKEDPEAAKRETPHWREMDEVLTLIAKKGDPLDNFIKQYTTPSGKRKLILRASIQWRRTRYGTVKSKKIITKAVEPKGEMIFAVQSIGDKGKVIDETLVATAEEAEALVDRLVGMGFKVVVKKKGKALPRAEAEIDVELIARETEVREESEEARLKRLARAKKARSALETAVRRSGKFIERLENPKSTFGKVFAETDPDTGQATVDASELRIAKAYYVILNELAMSLIESGHTSAKSSQAMEQLNRRLREIMTLKPTAFVRQLNKMAKAQEREGLKGIPDKRIRGIALNKQKREATIQKYYKDLMTKMRKRAKQEHIWKKNPYYNSVVGPLMNKFIDSIASKGWPDYRPSEAEMLFLQNAMQGWRNDPKWRQGLYNPLKQFFEGVGVKFDAKGDVIVDYDTTGAEDFPPEWGVIGKYKWEPGYPALHAKAVKLLQAETEPKWLNRFAALTVEQESAHQFNVSRERFVQEREEAATAADRRADKEQLKLLRQVNRAIEALAKVAGNSKSTIKKLATAEMNFIRKMKQLGVWEDTPSKQIGKIRVGTVRNYRRVGLALLQKKISKADARRTMQSIKTFPEPKGIDYPKYRKTVAERELDEALEALAEPIATTPQALQELELLLQDVDPVGNAEQFTETTAAIGDLLQDRTQPSNIKEVLDAIIESMPEGHFYRRLAERLRGLNINWQIPVEMDWEGTLPGNVYGRYKVAVKDVLTPRGVVRRTQPRILINRSYLMKLREQGVAFEADLVHTILHEIVHAATRRSLQDNPGLVNMMLQLRDIAIAEYGRFADKLPYGLRTVTDKSGVELADEFVAEAMSNQEFQNNLKQIFVDERESLFRKFANIVRNLLGMSENTPVSVMDFILAAETQLFEGAELTTPLQEIILNMDSAAQPSAIRVLSKINDTNNALGRIWNSVKKLGLKAPLSAMTMRQLNDTFKRFFGGEKGPLNKYITLFGQRNARQSDLLAKADKLVRDWTALNEKHGKEWGDKFSALATDATEAKVAVAQSLDSPANEHLTSKEDKARWLELRRRHSALPKEYRQLYDRLQAYYREALNNEINLMMLSALRGVLSLGKETAVMTAEEFDAKYTPKSIQKFDTPEKFKAEFAQYFDDANRADMMATINQMASIRQMRRGDYFPLKRYGDYVVYATKRVSSKEIIGSKRANEYAAEQRRADPTVEVWLEKVVGAPTENTYKVIVADRDFRMAETATEAEAEREHMVELYGEKAVGGVEKRINQKVRNAAIGSNQALNQIIGTLSGNPAAQAAIKNFYLDQLNEQAFRKHSMKRKNVKGAKRNLQLRNFAMYSKQSSYYTAQLEYGGRLADAIGEVDRYVRDKGKDSPIGSLRMSEIRNELVERDEMTADPADMQNVVKRSVEFTQFMMLTSPSYWMINASQPWMVTLPVLTARHGMGNALAALKNAQSLIISPLVRGVRDSKGGLEALRSKIKAEEAFNVLDQVYEHLRKRDPENAENYIAMLKEVERNNLLNLSWIAELRDISEGIDPKMTQKILDASRIMAHLTEVNNRVLTSVAAYDLAVTEAKANPRLGDPHKYGIEQAMQAVSETQFDYSAPNKPRLFQPGGPMGRFSPLVFQFMQWPQHMYALMIKNFYQATKGESPEVRKEARNILYGVFTTHLLAGGILGATLQPVKWAIGLTMAAFGDDDDTVANAISGESYDRWVAQNASKIFGSEISLLLSKGLPAALGGDLSQRMSLGTVFFLDFRGNNAESIAGSLMLGLGGATVNLVGNYVRGAQHMLRGDYQKALESASPKILRDIVKTHRYWNEGLVNNAGDTLIAAEDVGFRPLFLQALGIQPSRISQFYSAERAIKDAERYYRDRKSDIFRDFRVADTPAERRQVVRDAVEFSRRNPALRITYSDLIRSKREQRKRERRIRLYGANIDERAARQFAKEADPYR